MSSSTTHSALKHSSRNVPVIDRLLGPFARFTGAETSGGIVLMACAIIALVWANSPWAESYDHFWHIPVTLGSDIVSVRMSLQHWINDGLMAIFFFLVGLEIKRELLVGELASVRNAALPIAAAVGGMVIPAILYSLVNGGKVGAPGWGIPMATDIAFSLGVLTLLGSRVPIGLKVFLTALAIVDDLGAVLVIALFYTSEISLGALGVGFGAVAVALIGNLIGIRRPVFYFLVGIVAWFGMLHSGVHATIAGVLMAFMIPARTRIDEEEFSQRSQSLINEFNAHHIPDASVRSNPAQQEIVWQLEQACEEVQAPLNRMEHSLHTVVAFLIMPLFALANAGVSLSGSGSAPVTGATEVTIGVILGLLIGKPLGITLFSWLAVRFKMAVLPQNTSWRSIHGVSWLGGIGFTMSLFVATLAFGEGELLAASKLGILGASVLAGIVGWMILRRIPASS
jgi:NhaA family Na+:H+ antiporter